MRKIKAGFIGIGEVNSPRELIERKCCAAKEALEERGIELAYTEPVSDDPPGKDEARAGPSWRAQTLMCWSSAWPGGSLRTPS